MVRIQPRGNFTRSHLRGPVLALLDSGILKRMPCYVAERGQLNPPPSVGPCFSATFPFPLSLSPSLDPNNSPPFSLHLSR